MKYLFLRVFIFIFSLFFIFPISAFSSQAPAVSGFPVRFMDQVLFTINADSSQLSARERAAIITNRLKEISHELFLYGPDSVKAVENKGNIIIVIDQSPILTVTEEDASNKGISREELADLYVRRLKVSIETIKDEYSFNSILWGLFFSILTTILLVMLIRLLLFLFPKVNNYIDSLKDSKFLILKIQRFELIKQDSLINILKGISNFFKSILIIILIYFYIPLVLNFFPWTKNIAHELFDYIINPVKQIISAFIAFIPNAFSILAIIICSYYINKLIKIIFTAVENGNLNFPGFDQDWAKPTYIIIRFLIISFSLVMIFPYIPGSKSPAFQGVSVFIGILISFGSSSAISNIVSGAVLTYMNSFKIGERVKIADITGDIVEKNLLVTRIRTVKNVYISIPNSMVLNNYIINYSKSSNRDSGLILNTSITIGYDVPWRKVHEELIKSALASEGILKEPKPFVLQTALNDFYVSYELNAYTRTPKTMSKIYSELHQNIQDKFNEAGIEIMSSHYSAIRDGNMTTIPEQYLSDDYTVPGIRVENISKEA